MCLEVNNNVLIINETFLQVKKKKKEITIENVSFLVDRLFLEFLFIYLVSYLFCVL